MIRHALAAPLAGDAGFAMTWSTDKKERHKFMRYPFLPLDDGHLAETHAYCLLLTLSDRIMASGVDGSNFVAITWFASLKHY